MHTPSSASRSGPLASAASPGAACDAAALLQTPDFCMAVAQTCLAEGRISAEDLVAACLERAHAHEGLNAFITLDATGALAEARRVDAARRRGEVLPPLAGIPVVVKDNIHAAGLPATAGTPALADFIPAADAPVLQRLRAAGAIVLGKTNMHELAFGATGYNHAFHGTAQVGVRNPYDPTRIAGGSSSGSAAALGARLALGALGTDTGGSMRIPCALNACASLRPSMGRYPSQGLIPISTTRDTAGPMALCMSDVALLDALVCGDPALPSVALSGLRLGVVAGFWANLDDEVAAVTAQLRAQLEAVGVQFVDIADQQLQALNAAIGFPVVLHEAYDAMVDYLATQGPGISIETLVSAIASPDVKAIYEHCVLPRRYVAADGSLQDSPAVYAEAIAHGRPALQAHYRKLFADYRIDAFVFPTVPVVAPLARPEVSLPENFHLLIQNTEPAASAGLPCIQLPVGVGAHSGLPVGLELDGPAGSDRRLLAIGMALEAVLGRVPAAP